MKLFKTIDEKFAEIGFVKRGETRQDAVYERLNKQYHYTQVLHLMRKLDGNHIIQSYDKRLYDNKNIGNTCVGLTMYEVKLCLKKMKQLRWNPNKNLGV